MVKIDSQQKNKNKNFSLNVKSIIDILRKDDGVWPKYYIFEFSWILFLKIFEDIEKERQKQGEKVVLLWTKYSRSYWTKTFKNKPDELLNFIKKELFPYLQSLKDIPVLQTIFVNLKQTNIKNWRTLIEIINKFENLDFSILNDADNYLFSKVYEEILINMWKEWSRAGEYYTPKAVVKFIIDILKPSIKDNPNLKILDPFAWSCGFLIEAYKYNLENFKDSLTQSEKNKLKKEVFYWIEKKFEAWLIGLMNLFVHWIDFPNFVLNNSFKVNFKNYKNKFDFVLTNPPFWWKEHNEVYKSAEFADYKTSVTEALWLQFVMKSLKPWWKAGIILPTWQILFGGSVFQKIRKHLIENFNLKYIIFLPEWTFSSVGTNIKTAILIFENTWKTKITKCFKINWKYTKKKQIKYEHLKPLIDYILGKTKILPENVEETIVNWEEKNKFFKKLEKYLSEFSKSDNIEKLLKNFENFITQTEFYKNLNYLDKAYIRQIINDVKKDKKEKTKLIEWLKSEIEKFDYSFMIDFWNKEAEEKIDLNHLEIVIDESLKQIINWWEDIKRNLESLNFSDNEKN